MSEQTNGHPAPANVNRPDWRQRAVLGSGVLAVVLASGLWIYRALTVRHEEPERQSLSYTASQTGKHAHATKLSGRESFLKSIPQPKQPSSFLEAFTKTASVAPGDKSPVPDDAALNKQWDALQSIEEQLRSYQEQLNAAGSARDAEKVKCLEKRLTDLSADTDDKLKALEKDLRRARVARPHDAVPQWLTGELLLFARGEPKLILPYFQRALKAGLGSPRLWASLSRVQLGGNQIQQAYDSALKAWEQGAGTRYEWQACKAAAFATEHFQEVLTRLHALETAKSGLPSWAAAIRNEAQRMEQHWSIEQELRRREAAADDLPRVKLLVEHRHFSPRKAGAVESTGTDEIVLELFADQAPATVANFLKLVEQKFYDGTKFYLSDPGNLVAGGCPLTKNADPADDGTGGPGYTIPDEFSSPKARRHFRGTLSMVNFGRPDSAGSQFFITLVPQPAMDGKYTVFGRVLKGQEAVERITQGRTHPDAGPFGPIIPGDVLVHAEVLRKRAPR